MKILTAFAQDVAASLDVVALWMNPKLAATFQIQQTGSTRYTILGNLPLQQQQQQDL